VCVLKVGSSQTQETERVKKGIEQKEIEEKRIKRKEKKDSKEGKERE